MRLIGARPQARFARRLIAVSLGVAVCAAVVPRVIGPTDSADAAPTQVIARYEMNETAGATVLVDSSGNGLNGAIRSDVDIVQFDASTRGHRFALVQPDTTVTFPNHDDVVPDNAILDPGTDEFAVTVRFRKSRAWGNILQKGQNTVPGGYFKIEMPGDTASCLFKDDQGHNGGLTTPPTITKNGMTTPLDISDNQWHVLRCERLKTEVKMFVDGVEVAKTGSVVGNISNDWPLVFGGKIDCNPPAPGVTCDYYTGDIDYVYFEKGAGVAVNQPPVPAFTDSCDHNVCTLNASTSKDNDGTITSWAWDFGDGSTGTGQIATHTYAAAGRFTATLTLTDDDGAQSTLVHHVDPLAPPVTTSPSTTTTSVVAQLPPEGLTVIPDAAAAGAIATRGDAFDATQSETATTVGGD